MEEVGRDRILRMLVRHRVVHVRSLLVTNRFARSIYNYFRDYDPQTGRYIEGDPIGLFGGSYSTYVFVAGNPIMYIDPLGLCWMFSQSTGLLTHVDADGTVTNVGTGYSGYGA